MFESRKVFAKDNRENINASQKRRGSFFQREMKEVATELQWADGKTFTFGETTVKYSQALPHGPQGTRFGYVLATTISTPDATILFAPDVQGPVVDSTLAYLLSTEADLLIVGGPPIYIDSFHSTYSRDALTSLRSLAAVTPKLIVDHHLMRSPQWSAWLRPVATEAEKHNKQVLTMAELAGEENNALESQRRKLYSVHPPSEEFSIWADSTDEYKKQNKPPIR